jgi:predicted phage terminase large subunit-like protein
MIDALDILATMTPADFATANARADLHAFVQSSLAGFKSGWFHRDICARLQRFSERVARAESPRLLLMAPPRHGKSFMAAERLPVWHLGHNPDHEVAVASYGLAVAQDRTKAARDLAMSELVSDVFPDLLVSTDSRAKASWALAGHKGKVQAVGVNGPLTGRGAHILILDDLVKDHAAAMSAQQRDSVWDWFLSTGYTRLAPGGGILGIMTRWHEDDWAGRVLFELAHEGWDVIRYPALATTDEPHRQAGDALHPDRFPADALERIREALGTRIFQALYQQEPSTPGGSVWLESWWQHWTTDPDQAGQDGYMAAPPGKANVVQSWDLTFKAGGTSYVVGHVWVKHGGRFYLIDEYRGKWGFVETKARIESAVRQYPRTKRILIEDKANGPAIMDALRGTLGNRLVPVQPDGSKVARAHAVAGLIEAGRVVIPDPASAPWVHGFLTECTEFPTGAHDDRVDTVSQALRYLSKRHTLRVGHL